MVTVDLITGFLGAGKTTFIQKYIRYLHKRSVKVHIIENEFGPVSVDTTLLRRDSDECGISDLTGLCMCCVGKTAFKDALIDSAAAGIDRIIVEPSGIYDVDEFFDVLGDPRVRACCDIGSILTITDCEIDARLTDECRYLMYCQLLASGIAVVSKTQLSPAFAVRNTKAALDELMRSFGCEEGLEIPVIDKNWDELTDTDMDTFMQAGYNRVLHERRLFSHSEAFQSSAVLCSGEGLEDVKAKIRRLFDTPECGTIYRVKGIVSFKGHHCCEVNCTPGLFSVTPCFARRSPLVVIGQRLNEELIRSICSAK